MAPRDFQYVCKIVKAFGEEGESLDVKDLQERLLNVPHNVFLKHLRWAHKLGLVEITPNRRWGYVRKVSRARLTENGAGLLKFLTTLHTIKITPEKIAK